MLEADAFIVSYCCNILQGKDLFWRHPMKMVDLFLFSDLLPVDNVSE